ncbi:hypothetical protein ACFP1Z_00225 [Streptomyces gamaensis]|uniref:Lipoprotein n=1 Tax=Streptomyces gamaensis TaxID=1763542 RepID=A0ABW0YUX5_9ACTN
MRRTARLRTYRVLAAVGTGVAAAAALVAGCTDTTDSHSHSPVLPDSRSHGGDSVPPVPAPSKDDGLDIPGLGFTGTPPAETAPSCPPGISPEADGVCSPLFPQGPGISQSAAVSGPAPAANP